MRRSAIALLAAAGILAQGCTTSIERPAALGLVKTPTVLDDGENQVRMRQILEAAMPHPQLPDPATAAMRVDPRLASWLDRIAYLISQGHPERALQMLDHIIADLSASERHDLLALQIHTRSLHGAAHGP